jgi:branched-chain amino acid transport system ATP-binding protein
MMGRIGSIRPALPKAANQILLYETEPSLNDPQPTKADSLQSLLTVSNLCVRYGGVVAVDEASLFVGKGEVVAVIGANGAGKSSTLMALSGLVEASGSVVFDGEDISELSAVDRVAKGIVQIPEGRRIFGRLSVMENLKLGAFLRKDKAEIKRNLEMVLELFPILKERCDQKGGTLSGGEQQMLAIARGVMSKPRLLLLDEPSLGLSPIYSRKIFDIIQVLAAEGRSILLVEQNARAALKISSRAYCLENGRVTLTGPSAEMAVDERVKAAYLGG